MQEDIHLHSSILNELGCAINTHSVILDFGCGQGEQVFDYRNAGFNAFGAGIILKNEDDFLRLIHTTGRYQIPFPDETFDFVFSRSVFEHVRDRDSALSEIWRILKPGGFSLHFFPPKWKPIEAHVFVSLGGVIQEYWWLVIWALLEKHSCGHAIVTALINFTQSFYLFGSPVPLSFANRVFDHVDGGVILIGGGFITNQMPDAFLDV